MSDGVPIRLRTSTIKATPAAMGRFLRQLGDDIERADGDLILIGLAVFPDESGDPAESDWVVQVTVDDAAVGGAR